MKEVLARIQAIADADGALSLTVGHYYQARAGSGPTANAVIFGTAPESSIAALEAKLKHVKRNTIPGGIIAVARLGGSDLAAFGLSHLKKAGHKGFGIFVTLPIGHPDVKACRPTGRAVVNALVKMPLEYQPTEGERISCMMFVQALNDMLRSRR